MNQPNALHVGDGDLIGLVDGVPEPAERRVIEAHLADCGECRGRLEDLLQRSRAITGLLMDADPVMPHDLQWPPVRTVSRPSNPGASARWIKAAAVVALLATSAMAVQPVRGWIAQHSRQLWSLLTRPGSNLGNRGLASNEALGSVSFHSTGNVLLLEVSSRQAEGTLVIEGGQDSLTSLTITGSQTTESLVVLPTAVRIVNQPGSRATYRLQAAGSITEVMVRIASEPAVRFQPVRPDDRWTVDLTP